VVAGVETQRANTAAIVAAGNRCVLIVDGTYQRLHGAGVGGIRWTYSSASNFATATSGAVGSLGTGGVVSDLAVYPRTFTAAGL
jgi:hypothetical protein